MKQVPCSKNFHMGRGIRILHPYVQQFNSELAPEKLPGPNIGSRIGKKPTTMNFQEKRTRWWFHLFFLFTLTYCWWFRNPNNHLGYINLVNNGRETTNLNWWSPDFWTINSREDVQIEVCLWPCHLVVAWSCAVQVGVPCGWGKGRRNTLCWLPEGKYTRTMDG